MTKKPKFASDNHGIIGLADIKMDSDVILSRSVMTRSTQFRQASLLLPTREGQYPAVLHDWNSQ